MSHQHYEGCYRHHFVCAQERIRDLERELATRKVPTFGGPYPAYLVDAPGMEANLVPFTHPIPPPCTDRIPGGATWTVPAVDEPPVTLTPESHP